MQTHHPRAETLATLIWSHRNAHGTEYAAYTVIDQFMDDMGDEAKADLYATIAETVTDTMPFVGMVEAVDKALVLNTKRFN